MIIEASHLDAQYHLLEDNNQELKIDRCQVYFNLIELKRASGLINYGYPIYVDVKRWITFTLEDFEFRDFGYDKLPLTDFIDQINNFPTIHSIELLYFLERKCSSYGFDFPEIKQALRKARGTSLKENRKWWQYILFLAGNNIFSLFIVFLLFLICLVLVMLPAPIDAMECFVLNEVTFSDIPILNYSLNALAMIGGIDSSTPILTPINPFGVIVYTTGQFLFYAMIVNFLYQKIIDFITSHLYE